MPTERDIYELNEGHKDELCCNVMCVRACGGTLALTIICFENSLKVQRIAVIRIIGTSRPYNVGQIRYAVEQYVPIAYIIVYK